MVLSDKQKRFCQEYIIDFNGAGAAIRSGYSKKTAKEQASRLLTKVHVSDYINRLIKKTEDKLQVTREMVLEGYRKLAFYDSRKFYDENGNILDVPSLDDETAFALVGFEAEEKKFNVAADVKIIACQTTKIKMSDRKAALDGICKLLGYNAPTKTEVTGKDGTDIFPKLSKEQIDNLIDKL